MKTKIWNKKYKRWLFGCALVNDQIWTTDKNVLIENITDEVIICRPSEIFDKKRNEIYEGDLLLDRVYDKEAPNGEYYESELPIFFKEGAFRVDVSFNRDKLICDYLSIKNHGNMVVCGNIYE